MVDKRGWLEELLEKVDVEPLSDFDYRDGIAQRERVAKRDGE
jgi:hypothetical protein